MKSVPRLAPLVAVRVRLAMFNCALPAPVELRVTYKPPGPTLVSTVPMVSTVCAFGAPVSLKLPPFSVTPVASVQRPCEPPVKMPLALSITRLE